MKRVGRVARDGPVGRVRRVGLPGRRGWAVLLRASGSRQPQPDADGNVEATEVVVSSEVGGQLTAFTVDEAQMLSAGQMAGTVDPTSLTLQRSQLVAQREVAA